MKVAKCVICGCGFRQEDKENRCKDCMNLTLTEAQKLKAGLTVQGHKKIYTEEEIRLIVRDEIEQMKPDLPSPKETNNNDITLSETD
jgi:hypothetical protein